LAEKEEGPPLTTIDRPTREALHAGLVLDLNGLSSVGAMLGEKRVGEARRLRERFEQDWRLLDDLGWEAADPRQSFELTMPPVQLAEVLRRLHQRALACLRATALALSDCPSAASRRRSSDDSEGRRRWLEAQVDDELDLHCACVEILKRLEAVGRGARRMASSAAAGGPKAL
jgi:hypothetical protein